MERSYKLLPKARLDLENIFRYISVELANSESASVVIDKFQEKYNDICIFPKAYPLFYDIEGGYMSCFFIAVHIIKS